MTEQQDKPSGYALQVGKQAGYALDLQHEIFKEDAYEQLKKAGLKKGMVVWDVACGSGVTTKYLAEQVGDSGLVYAVDISSSQLEVTKEKIEEAGHNNVQFILDDINNLDSGDYKKADIVYSRFLLMHLNNPKKAIQSMASLLKPGGTLAMHESSFGSADKNYTADVKKLLDLFVEYGETKGFDYDIGRKIPEICKDMGIFHKITHFTKNYKTTDTIKELITLRLDEIQDVLINANLISKQDYTKLKQSILRTLQEETNKYSSFTKDQHYILASTKQQSF